MSPYRTPAEIPIHVDPLPFRRRRLTLEQIAAITGLVGLVFIAARAVVGCKESELPSEAAAAGYAAQQLACVDTYADKHNIDACRAKVRAAWGVADAGSDR